MIIFSVHFNIRKKKLYHVKLKNLWTLSINENMKQNNKLNIYKNKY